MKGDSREMGAVLESTGPIAQGHIDLPKNCERKSPAISPGFDKPSVHLDPLPLVTASLPASEIDP